MAGEKIIAKFTGRLDDWSREIWKMPSGTILLDVDGVLYFTSQYEDYREPSHPAMSVVKEVR